MSKLRQQGTTSTTRTTSWAFLGSLCGTFNGILRINFYASYGRRGSFDGAIFSFSRDLASRAFCEFYHCGSGVNRANNKIGEEVICAFCFLSVVVFNLGFGCVAPCCLAVFCKLHHRWSSLNFPPFLATPLNEVSVQMNAIYAFLRVRSVLDF
jgi:hypothetical protein